MGAKPTSNVCVFYLWLVITCKRCSGKAFNLTIILKFLLTAVERIFFKGISNGAHVCQLNPDNNIFQKSTVYCKGQPCGQYFMHVLHRHLFLEVLTEPETPALLLCKVSFTLPFFNLAITNIPCWLERKLIQPPVVPPGVAETHSVVSMRKSP